MSWHKGISPNAPMRLDPERGLLFDAPSKRERRFKPIHHRRQLITDSQARLLNAFPPCEADAVSLIENRLRQCKKEIEALDKEYIELKTAIRIFKKYRNG